MKRIKTQEAVGHVICHDIVEIVRGEKKEVAFSKGHVVKPEDIPVLLRLGKDHLYIWEQDESTYHENEGAAILFNICRGDHMSPSPVKEGKIDIFADCDGYFTVDLERLNRLNGLGEMMIATRKSDSPVKKGDQLAGTRVIPLVIAKKKMQEAVQLSGEKPLLQLVPYRPRNAAVIVTGNEVFYGRIQDQFSPVLEEKLKAYGGTVVNKIYCPDDPDTITRAIRKVLEEGAELVLCTGGMSVDPDDRTPLAIKNAEVEMVSYGAPVLPGAMFLMAYTAKGIPVMGLPGCVMYNGRTIFDLVLPKIFTDQKVTGAWLASLGNGGLCLKCPVCIYPACGFGR